MISKWQVRKAVNWFYQGKVFAYPTDTLYGLGCDPRNIHALRHLLALKQRAPGKGLILLAGDCAQLKNWIHPDFFSLFCADYQKNARTNAVPTTWLVADNHLSVLLTGRHGQYRNLSQTDTTKSGWQGSKIAVRISAHPFTRAFCHATGLPLVSTSANRSGAKSLTDARAVKFHFGARLPHIIYYPACGSANCTHSRASRIIDWSSGQVIRA